MMRPFDWKNIFQARRILLLTAIAVLSLAEVHAQGRRVVFPDSRMETAKAIQAIEQQSGMTFSYNSQLFDTKAPVVFSSVALSLDEAVTQLLAGKRLAFMYRNQYIIVHPDFSSQKAKPAPRNTPADSYAPTYANNMEPTPLRRPEETRQQARMVPVEKPVKPATFHSDYRAPESYALQGKTLPSLAVKTNLLYGLGTLTPNLAIEIGLGEKTSIALSGSYNPWNRIGTLDNNNKLVHFTVRPEFRYWFCERFNGHFVSASPFYDQFNISGKNIPFVGFEKPYRYEGNAIGFGVNYGYHLPLSGRWGVEFSAGVGVAVMKYDTFDCTLCSGVLSSEKKTYFGPTHFSASLVYVIR